MCAGVRVGVRGQVLSCTTVQAEGSPMQKGRTTIVTCISAKAMYANNLISYVKATLQQYSSPILKEKIV